MPAALVPFIGIAVGCGLIVAGIAYWKFNRRLTEWQWSDAPSWASRLRSVFGRSLDEEIWIGYLQAAGLFLMGAALIVGSLIAMRR